MSCEMILSSRKPVLSIVIKVTVIEAKIETKNPQIGYKAAQKLDDIGCRPVTNKAQHLWCLLIQESSR